MAEDYRSGATPFSQTLEQLFRQSGARDSNKANIEAAKAEQANKEKLLTQQGQQNQENTRLKSQLEQEQQEANLAKASDLVAKNAGQGRKVNVGLTGSGGVTISQNEANPLVQLSHMQNSQMNEYQKRIDAVSKPFKQQLDASENTINLLNQGNAAADKAAWINEASLALGGSGGRGIATVAAQMGFKPTSGNITEDLKNWINNTADPNMLASQRNALREMVYGRLPSMKQQYQSGITSLQQQGKLYPNLTNAPDILSANMSPFEDSFKRLGDMSTQYQQAKIQQQNPNNSSPSMSTPQRSTLQILGSGHPIDALKNFFSGNSSTSTSSNSNTSSSSGVAQGNSGPGVLPNGVSASSSAPAVGTVDSGHRFKGGNPADPTAWEPVQ